MVSDSRARLQRPLTLSARESVIEPRCDVLKKKIQKVMIYLVPFVQSVLPCLRGSQSSKPA